MMDSYFIYTEIINCGKIGKIALRSYHKHHNKIPVHIIGTEEDFKWIEPNENNIFIDIDKELAHLNLREHYKSGHKGTAVLWANLIRNRDEKYFIHFDSDVIFRDSLVSDLIARAEEGYDLVGQIRNYKNNPCNNDAVRRYADVVSTSSFLFNKRLIDDFDINVLTKMVQGGHNPLGHPVLDFFDPVSFNMLKNGAKVFFFEHDEVGGCNNKGERENKYGKLNNNDAPYKIDFGDKIVHFSGVGSGMNFYNNKNVNVPKSYVNYCLDRYALFCKIFYDEDIGIEIKQYRELLDHNWQV